MHSDKPSHMSAQPHAAPQGPLQLPQQPATHLPPSDHLMELNAPDETPSAPDNEDSMTQADPQFLELQALLDEVLLARPWEQSWGKVKASWDGVAVALHRAGKCQGWNSQKVKTQINAMLDYHEVCSPQWYST